MNKLAHIKNVTKYPKAFKMPFRYKKHSKPLHQCRHDSRIKGVSELKKRFKNTEK